MNVEARRTLRLDRVEIEVYASETSAEEAAVAVRRNEDIVNSTDGARSALKAPASESEATPMGREVLIPTSGL